MPSRRKNATTAAQPLPSPDVPTPETATETTPASAEVAAVSEDPKPEKTAGDEQPKCVACGKVLDWRDRVYGKGDLCKRCTRKAKDAALKGRFIPAREYAQQLKDRDGKPRVKAGR